MDETNLEQFRKKLCQMRDELHRRNQDAKDQEQAVELDQSLVGRLSRMDAIQMQQMAIASARRRERQIIEIDKALTRIDSGNYGYCISCDEPIEAGRLNFNPVVLHCIQCACKWEQSEQ